MVHERILFSGLDSHVDVPKEYRRLQRRHGAVTDEMSFADVLDRLGEQYSIEWRDLYYEEATEIEDYYPVSHCRALVNPAWESRLPEEIPGDREDAVWHIPTKKYTKVDHETVWRPLYEAIYNRGEAANVFGSVRARREGGEIHMDVFFENAGISTDSSDEITLGISTGHDYYGNVRLYVDVVAYHQTGDGVGQVMRYLVDPKRRKHTGTADEEVVAWFEDAVERLDTVSDKMYNIVADAMHYEVPMSDIPTTLSGFYEHLGLPNRGESTLADPAGERAVETAVGPYTAWHLYKAGMWAVEHEYNSRDTSSFKKHVQTVNTLLFNPSLAEKRVLKSCEEEIEETKHERDSEVWDFVEDSPDSTLKTIRGRAKSISEGVEEFESTKDRLTTLLTDEGVVESDPDDEENDE